jgi:transposase
MIPIPTGVRIWIATRHTDMRKGTQGLALLVQVCKKASAAIHSLAMSSCFGGRAGSLFKALWHDGTGLSLHAKRPDRGRFVWPATVDGVVALTAAQRERVARNGPRQRLAENDLIRV